MLERFLLFVVIPLLFVLMIVGVIGSENEKRDLQRQRVECFNKNELTADYIKCVAPIEKREAQIQEDEEAAAMSAALSAATSTMVIVQ